MAFVFLKLIFVKNYQMFFSLIIPVYNRPDELNELLQSLSETDFSGKFEVIVIEDGSSISCADVVRKFADRLDMTYFFKENSGPGDSRNFGMRKAKGDYFLIFDSDCIIPQSYLNEVSTALNARYVDCFGGPDKALDSFSNIQKAINFSMTSFVTTGGIRGGSEKIDKFQPRSFNMGISKKAFEASGGFGNIHPGEDPDLSIRLWNLGFETALFSKAYVYHKRRIDWEKFSMQVNKFGKARPILDKWHPEYKKITFLFPSFFIAGFAGSLILMLINVRFFFYLYILYFVAVFIVSGIANKNLKVGLLSVAAVFIQFYGYGTGYIKSFIKINLLKQQPQEAFPELFF